MIYLARFLALRYWLRHRGAFFLSTLGVTLGLAVFVSIQVANHSVLASFAASLDAVTGKANLQIVGGQAGLPDNVFARLMSTRDATIREHVQGAAPLISRTLYSPTLKSALLVMGVDLFSEAPFRDYHLGPSQLTGTGAESFARFVLDPQSIALSESLARRHNIKIGDSIVLFVGAERRSFRVTTILDSEAAGRAFGGDFALVDIATAQEKFAQLGRISQIDLIVDEAALDEVAARIRTLLPSDATVQRPVQRGSQVADLLSAFQLNLSALSSIALSSAHF
jgi:putative ABC transport system permease protein